MSRFTLLFCEVPHNRSEFISKAAVDAGSFGGTVLMGRKISANHLAVALGIGNTTVDILCILVEDDSKNKIVEAIVKCCENEKPNFGVLISAEADCLVKTGSVTEGEGMMVNNGSHELITVILNIGYADDAMAAARKAGAGGGTVINARGTAREDDAQFFGMHIVPEKEMLLIVVEKEKKMAVLESIRTLECLSEPGSGIAFCAGADDFTLLGKKIDK